MLIKYTGAMTKRVVGAVVWSKTARVQAVDDPDMLADVLTMPDFAIAPDEPMAAVVGEWLPPLALSGICTFPQLAKLNAKQIRELADSLGVAHSEVKEWVTSARALTKAEPAAETSGDLLDEESTLTAVAPPDDGGE